jgi:hypothetical protein
MQETIAQLKEKGFVVPPKVVVKKEAKKEAPVKKDKETPVDAKPEEKVIEAPVAETAQKVREAPVKAPEQVVPITLEEKILDFINNHPKGVRISEMEEPLGKTRMKLGFIAKNLLDSGKVQKIDTVYFPLKK